MEDSRTRRQQQQSNNPKTKKNVWFSLKKSLQCKSEASEVQEPKSMKEVTKRGSGMAGCGGCSRSIANLKDVIHGSKRHMEKAPISSPRSIGSSEFLNPITHEVILNNSTCELKITGVGDMASRSSTYVGMLRPGTPMHHRDKGYQSSRRVSLERDWGVSSRPVSCHKCGEGFTKVEAAEAHHLSKHAVTELVEGESSRKIVEIICRTSWLKAENQCGRIDRVLKVHNMHKTLARFEEYRETVKIRASKLSKKHPRCLADGNELLRFHGTTVACALGIDGSTTLCTADKCCVCRIIRNGFSGRRVFTASTSGRAFESISVKQGDVDRKVLIVCRVIAGRVHRPVEEVNGLMMSGFDSLAGKVGLYTNVEELFLLNPRALLPCFLVICKS